MGIFDLFKKERETKGTPTRDLPLSRFDGFARQADAANFTSETRRAMELAFPGFLELQEPTAAMHLRMDELAKSGVDYVTWRSKPHRRFAGSENLPRGCYYSVAQDENGNDNGTLIGELLAYYDPTKCGLLMVADLAYQETLDHFGLSQLKPRNSIGIIFIGRPGAPSAYLSSLTAEERNLLGMPDPAVERVMHMVEMPYKVHRLLIDDVIDLRLAKTQQWFVENFGMSDFEGYEMPSRKNIHKFTDMLPALLWPEPGGCDLTHAIGVWLRRHGIKALIFPSARADSMTFNRNGTLQKFVGFNLVNYRHAPIPDPLGGYHNVDTDYMCMRQPGVQLRLSDEVAEDGTWMIVGNRVLQQSRITELEKRFISDNAAAPVSVKTGDDDWRDATSS